MIIARLCCFVCDLPAFAQRQRHTDDECNGVLFGSLGENQHPAYHDQAVALACLMLLPASLHACAQNSVALIILVPPCSSLTCFTSVKCN